MEYAEGQFQLDKVQEDGNTLRQHLRAASGKMVGWRIDARLDAKCPEHYAQVWSWFRKLSAERQYVAKGMPLALTATHIKDWCALRCFRPTVWETNMIAALDALFLKVFYGH